MGQWIKSIIALTTLSLCFSLCNRADHCPCRVVVGMENVVNSKTLGRSRMTVTLTHGLSRTA